MSARESSHLLEETSEHEFAELVDRARRELDSLLLVELLPERIPVYRDRSANTVNRMRGYLLAAFESAGLPEEALPYVFEELESGRGAYLVAAAARALRGRASRSSDALPFLLKAIDNIKYADDAVSFDSYRPSWPVSRWISPGAARLDPRADSRAASSRRQHRPRRDDQECPRRGPPRSGSRGRDRRALRGRRHHCPPARGPAAHPR